VHLPVPARESGRSIGPFRSGRVLFRAAVALVGIAAFTTPELRAFPPAPFHTLYGMVRDENGNALDVAGASVVFFRDGVEVLRETIGATTALDHNYQFRLRMDMQRPGTSAYTSLANTTGATFTVGVRIHDIVYYPIEMSVSRSVGNPGERIRLDLTLGVDSDGDGLPDAWEQSQLYAGGIPPGPDGWDLSLIDRDGDFDGDGVSNWAEYIAGTYASDPTDHLALQVVETLPGYLRLRFFGIYGKTYSLESSTDLRTWGPADFHLDNPAEPAGDPDVDAAAPPPLSHLRATATGFVDLYAPADASGRTFYRLKVR